MCPQTFYVAFEPQLLSLEDFVVVVPGAGQLQQLLCVITPVLLSRSVSPLQKVSPALSTRPDPPEVWRKLIPRIPDSRHQPEARPGYQDLGEDWMPGAESFADSATLAGAQVPNWPVGLVPSPQFLLHGLFL